MIYFSPQEYEAAESYEDVKDNLGLVLYSKEVAAAREREMGAIFVKDELPGGIVAFLEVLMQDENGEFYHVPLDTEQVVDEGLDIDTLISDGITCMSKKLPAVFTHGNPQFFAIHTNSPFGGSAIVYPDMMKQIGEKLESNYFILPANRDMMIIAPDNGEKELSALEMALVDQNKKADPELMLSNTVLYYDLFSSELKTAREAKSDKSFYLNRTMSEYIN